MTDEEIERALPEVLQAANERVKRETRELEEFVRRQFRRIYGGRPYEEIRKRHTISDGKDKHHRHA